MLTRRELIQVVVGIAAQPLLARFPVALDPAKDIGWVIYKGSPVLGGQYGTCFDICVLREQEKYKMWVSW